MQIKKSAEKPINCAIFLHGAGAGPDSFFIDTFSDLLTQNQTEVWLPCFPYMQKIIDTGKRRPPDRAAVLDAFVEQIIKGASNDLPIFLIGKSMGARVACRVDHEKIQGRIALGFPLHPPGKPEKSRATELQQCPSPLLILQGERDPLGSFDEVQKVVNTTNHQLVLMTDGDHDFKPRKKSGLTHQQQLEFAADQCVRFMSG